MRSAEQVIWDLVHEWLACAEEDLHVAQELMGRERISYNPVGFHAQQAAEKFIKALLTCHQIPFPKTHNIEELLVLAEKAASGILDELRDVMRLSPYGAVIRYPGDRPILTRQDGADAVRLADQTRVVVLHGLENYLRRGRPGTSQ
jgi:HEPN domain-containing protein